jgi:hypothetical protein
MFQVEFYVEADTSDEELLQMSRDFVSHQVPDGWALEGDKGEMFEINIIDKFIIK